MCDLRSKFATGAWLLPLGVAALLLGLFTGSAMAQTSTLSGVVTDADTSEPIEGALVMVRTDGMGGPQLGGRVGAGSSGGGQGALHALSDDTGAYVIEDLEPGDYAVACGKIGYAVARVTLTLVEGQNTFDFALEPVAFGAVAGRVTDASMVPIPGARVVLTTPVSGELGSPNGGSGSGGSTGGSGSGGSTGGSGGSGSGTGGSGGSGSGTGGSGGSGSGTGGSGGSGGGTGGGMGLNALTGDDGTYLIDNVPVGDYAAVAMAYGYATSEPFSVTVVEGMTTEGVDFALEPLTFGSLEGYVTDSVTTLGLEGATVLAFQHVPGMRPPQHGGGQGGGGCSNVVQTDVDGFYRFEELAAGTWTVRAMVQGYLRAEVEVDVVADTTNTQDFALDPR